MSDSGGKFPEASAMADLSGRTLGNVQVLRRVGRGAMAEVYLGQQRLLNRRVAVKVLKPELADNPAYLKRFEREAQAAAALVHANIVQIHEVGHSDRLHYIVQEYVGGLNLRQWLARHGPAKLGRALSIMRQTAAALAKAADEGVVHRDIKPENIMLTDAGEVKVADFGLARLTRDDESLDLTRAGMTMGTPLYMSPEQVEGKPLDSRSDIYSLGATCYQMLSGSPPFVGETALGVAVQHLKKEPQSLESLRPDLPPALCRVVHKMLAKDLANRWQSPQELLRELRRIQQEYCPEGAADLGEWEAAAAPTADPRLEVTRQLAAVMKAGGGENGRRRPWLAAVCLAAALAASGGIAWLVRQKPLLVASDSGHVQIPRQSTALRQYFCASQIGAEEAWRSVIEYFPEKKAVVRRAKQQLARIALRQRNDAQAMALFDALAADPDEDKELRAFGLAGEVGLLTLQGKYQESAKVLDELLPIRDELRDEPMRKMLDYAIKENRDKLGPQSRAQWDKWLQSEFPAGE